eukprot:COSAG02_NODE_2173_length_9590_cov_39.075229_8_plen_152_part_00
MQCTPLIASNRCLFSRINSVNWCPVCRTLLRIRNSYARTRSRHWTYPRVVRIGIRRPSAARHPSEPATSTTVESANRLQILHIHFTSQLYGSPHTIGWALLRGSGAPGRFGRALVTDFEKGKGASWTCCSLQAARRCMHASRGAAAQCLHT